MTRPPVQPVSLIGCLLAAWPLVASPPVFLARRDYAASAVSGGAVGDANGDGSPDLIWLGGSGVEEITVLFGNSKGTFHPGIFC